MFIFHILYFKNYINKPKIQVSIDGDSGVHDHIRGRSTFSKSMINIDILSKEGFAVIIATTVSNKNIESIRSLDKELENIKFFRWNLKRIVGSGRADDAVGLRVGELSAEPGDQKLDRCGGTRSDEVYRLPDQHGSWRYR